MEVNAQSELAILLFDKEYWSSTRRSGRMNESSFEVLVNELVESGKFCWGEGVDQTQGWKCSFLEVDLEVVRLMGR